MTGYGKGLFAVLVGVVGGVALAQEPEAEAETEEPWMADRYEVEIIVFRHVDQSRNTPEQAATEIIDRFSSLALYPESNERRDAAESDRLLIDEQPLYPPEVTFELMEVGGTYPDFTPLDADSEQLGNVYSRLERLDAYQPILHRAWSQAARPADQSVPMRVTAPADGDLAAGDLRLDGTLTVYKERFVHLAVDLDLGPDAPPQATQDSGPWPAFGDVFTGGNPEATPLQNDRATTAFKLQESRRIRGTSAQYFDHPQFGLIARITRIESDEEEETADAAAAN
ncbi:MAG: CsiV family protein [Gammaproteobacteria bacterium]